jgi:hypothetical protein
MSFGISIGDILKLCELAGRVGIPDVRTTCETYTDFVHQHLGLPELSAFQSTPTASAKSDTGRDCSGEYKTLTSQARSLSNLLEDIQDKYDKIPENKRQQLIDAYEPCIEVLQELDKILLHYNSLDTKSKRAWDRLKYDPDRSRNLRERLIVSVSMLNTFYTSLIHDSQVLILEALERLERDYKGGHREESIASIERLASGTTQDDEEEDDVAWSQILRDLEDVGVSQQQALSYRDVIVDWLVAAVNEGRLLEERPEQETSFSMSQDLGTALPELDFTETSHSLDVLTIIPLMQRSSSAPFPAPPSVPSPPEPQNQTVYLNPSTVSRSAHRQSTTSVQSESNVSSLYTRPEPSPLVASSANSSTYVIGRVPVPVSHASAPVQATPGPNPLAPPYMPPTIPPPLAPSDPITLSTSVAPPAYYEQGTSITVDLEWTAHQIVVAWAKSDYVAAEKHLEDQLGAVERGQTCTSGTQPDRRLLRHLIGVCASFSGKFPKAKRFFESVFNGIYLNRQNLDEGDIAAAQWLGDVCLHTQEHANAIFAYSVAYEGSIARFGATRDRTQRVAAEIRLLDHWLWTFRRIEDSLKLNIDPTDIFASTNVVEKSSLMINVKDYVYGMNGVGGNPILHQQQARPKLTVGPRRKYDLKISEGFLVDPLISLSTWPLPWDPTFYPMDAVQLDRFMNTVRIARIPRPLLEREIPTNSLGDSKKLHYLSKRGSQWLIDTVKRGLRDMGIEHSEHAFEPSIVCYLNQQRDGLSFSEGVEISFCKLPFRDVYGIKVSDVRWATRRFGAATIDLAQNFRDTTDFRNLIKSILESAEAEAEFPKSMNDMQDGNMSKYPISPSAPRWTKRPTYS